MDGIDPQELSSELNISRRQYYREVNQAIEAVADTLAILLGIHTTDNPETRSFHPVFQPPPLAEDQSRAEISPLTEMRCTLNLLETVQGVLQILEQIFIQQNISIELTIPPDTPPVAASAGLLRQILLSMLGFLANQTSGQAIVIRAVNSPNRVELILAVEANQAISAPDKRPWEEMAQLEDLEIDFDPQHPEQIFLLTLPLAGIQRVLAVDDNDDILQLYYRFLSAHRYQMIAETNPQQALELAVRLKPNVILLDLMMPGMDGWDVLQTLAHTPETSAIPVIVCSILPQKDLAHSLGAAAFLQKPISEAILIETLQSLNCI